MRRRLPAEVGSVGWARRLVADLLEAHDCDAVIDSVTLLVSETVTNAVLHAGTEIDVFCEVGPEVVRVEVADRSPVVPGVRHYELEAMTGRGLSMVDLIATAWGVDAAPDGKTVWFEVAAPADTEDGDEPAPAGTSTGAAVEFVVRLRGLPVALMRATLQYGDAVLRELALVAVNDGPNTWAAPRIDLSPVLDPVDRALLAGVDNLDLDVTFPAIAGMGAVERRDLVEEAERLAASGVLFTEPVVPEVGRCRAWLLGEIAAQSEGAAPRPWELPAPIDPARPPARLDEEALAALRRAETAVIVADDGNRIIFVNDQAAGLLGWAADELAGHRLTTIIPPELREAHLAGFTRFQLSGESRLLGQPVLVEALHRDGSRSPVVLTIRSLRTGGGRRAFRADLRPASPRDEHGTVPRSG